MSLLALQAWLQISMLPKFPAGFLIVVLQGAKVARFEVNQQRWLEESGQCLENVDRTHLVPASGKPVLLKVSRYSERRLILNLQILKNKFAFKVS